MCGNPQEWGNNFEWGIKGIEPKKSISIFKASAILYKYRKVWNEREKQKKNHMTIRIIKEIFLCKIDVLVQYFMASLITNLRAYQKLQLWEMY